MRALSIMPIGSCRIHNILKLGKEKFFLDADLTAQYALVFNTREILQQIAHMSGHLTLPAWSRPWLGSTSGCWRETGTGLGADVYFVEVSDPKIFEWRGLVLQQDSVNLTLTEAGGPDFFPIAWHDRWDDVPALRARFRSHPRFAGLPMEIKAFLMAFTMTWQADEDLAQDMARIVDLLSPGRVVFSAQCRLDRPGSESAAQRNGFIANITAHAAALGCPFLDPTATLETLGEPLAFQNDGRDLGHFTEPFETLLVERIAADYLS